MQEKKEEPRWRIEVLGKKHDRTQFSCGNEQLDQYLKNQTGQDVKKRVTVPFELCEGEDNIVLGYYTLSNFSVDVGAWPKEVTQKLPRYPMVPVTLLGRLAADSRIKGKRAGEYLLMDALHRSLRASREVASVAVVVDAIDGSAVEFYRHYEFTRFADEPLRLFLPMAVVEKLFGNE